MPLGEIPGGEGGRSQQVVFDQFRHPPPPQLPNLVLKASGFPKLALERFPFQAPARVPRKDPRLRAGLGNAILGAPSISILNPGIRIFLENLRKPKNDPVFGKNRWLKRMDKESTRAMLRVVPNRLQWPVRSFLRCDPRFGGVTSGLSVDLQKVITLYMVVVGKHLLIFAY